MPDESSPPEGVAIVPAGRLADLKVRLASAAVLVAVAFAALAGGPYAFGAVVTIVAALMSWEWGRVVRSVEPDVPMIVHVAAVALAGILTMMQAAALGLAVLLVGTFLVVALLFGNRPTLSALGVLYTGLPAVALIWIYADAPLGIVAIVLLIIIVATTDTFAFFSGRLIGGPKLIPRLSPNKTWAGLIGGVTAAAIAAAIYGYVVEIPPARLAVDAVFLGLVSQAGDLLESSLKRAFGVKDASNLIPGHGGFMDRMDGLAAAAGAAGLAALFLDPSAPAHLLLYWR